MNIVLIEGHLSSAPRHRDLPSGSVLHSYEVSTCDDGVTRSVPVVWLDPVRAPNFSDGDQVVVVGSIRRRFFRAGGAVASRTEVEAELVVRPGSARAGRACAAAVAVASAAPDPPGTSSGATHVGSPGGR